jgi:hypothetical protein
MREPRDDGPFPDFEGKTPAKRPPGGKPPCFMRIYFPRERFDFQIRPSAKVESEPFFDLQESKVESRFDFGPPKGGSRTLFQRKSNLKVEFRFDFGKSRGFKNQPDSRLDTAAFLAVAFAESRGGSQNVVSSANPTRSGRGDVYEDLCKGLTAQGG